MRAFFKLGVMALVLVLLVTAFTGCSGGGTPKTMSMEDAKKEVSALAANVNATTIGTKLDPNETYDLEDFVAGKTLPDISEYPFVVNPTTETFITVYSSNERIISLANKFNSEEAPIAGVSVGVRAVPAGLGTNFILSGKYRPDILVASDIHSNILADSSIAVTTLEAFTVKNVSGLVVAKKVNVTTFDDALTKINSKQLAIGYVDPLQDADGLNFILSVLHNSDSANLLSETAVEGLRKLQDNISYIANTPQQLRSSTAKGIIDGFATNYEAFKNISELQNDYTFIPFGVRQDNAFYMIGNELPAVKQFAAKTFAAYCKTGDVNAIESSHTPNITLNPGVAGEITTIYRSIKGGSNDVTAVFVADTSGSMRGNPILKLKTGLRRGASAIDPNNNIGLVTFSSDVKIAVPIAKFDGKQQSYFSNAVSNLSEGGGTAMYDGIMTAAQMLMEAKATNPNTKLILFVLTDGDSNQGYSFNRVEKVLRGLQIPIYTIGYKSTTESLNTDALENLAGINEADFIDAENDNIVYILESLLAAQM